MFTTDREISAFGLGSFISICIGAKAGILENSTAIGLLAFTGVLLAYRKYVYERERDRKELLADLIRFYREEILHENQNFLKQIDDNKHKLTFIKLDELDLQSIVKEYPDEAKEQMKITINRQLYTLQSVNILNRLEEFSIRVINNDAITDDLLTSLHTTFVRMIEGHAIALMRQRQIETGENTYSKTIELYREWEKLIDRRTSRERMTREWMLLYKSAEKELKT